MPLPASPRTRRRASVLVVVLVVCLGLVSLALVLGHSMLMAYRGADNELAARQADATILGAVQYAETLMMNIANPGDVPDPSTYQSQAVPLGEGTFWFIGVPDDGNTSVEPTFRLADEGAKLNLNRANSTMLGLLPNMTTDLAQDIVTWRTSSTAAATPATTAGSSGGVSISTGPVKQGFFESVEELGLVIGGTDNTLLYGDDVNLNHVLDPEETSTAGSLGQGQFTAGLLEYCTAFTREPNVMSDGTHKAAITSQTAVSRMVDKVLGSGRGATVTSAVRAALQREGIVQMTEQPIPGINGRPSPGEAEINTAWVNSILEFYAASGLNANDFATLAPYLANGTGDYTTGQVNVNTASETVLACVPGIGDTFAATLVSTRAQTVSPTNQADWAWVVTTLGARNCRTAGPYLTTRCYQMTADIAAVGRFGRGYRRTRFVVDTSTGNPQIIYRRDLTFLGWALGADERANLQNQQP